VIRLVVVASASIGLILFVAFVVSRLARTRARGMSIRMQVFLALAVVVGAFAFGLGLMVIDRVEARAVRLAWQAAGDEAASIAGVFKGEIVRSNVGIREVAARLQIERRRGADLHLELLDQHGMLLFPEDAHSQSGEAGSVTVDSPIVIDGRVLGSVRIVKPTLVMRRLLADFAPTVLVISLILGAAAALSAVWIGATIARPIERLTAFAERVSNGERVTPPVGDSAAREVTRLTRSIDSMRRQLEGRPFVEAFAADLSHELKNPVAAIRASAELLEEGALQEPEEARHFVGRIREASARIERLLGDLVSLARIEARGAEALEAVDIAQLARGAIDLLGEAAPRVSLAATGDTRVRGDATWLSRAVVNLVNNAVIHSAGPVSVAVERSAGWVVLTVRSEGEVPRHVRNRLFRRFVTTRADKGGSGLGLAIVRAVAEAHGGHADLADPGPPAVEFRLDLPPARRGAASQFRGAVKRRARKSPGYGG
jgi:two-component system, OmpR family, sensor histidine kinase CreC